MILALETATNICSVAYCDDEGTVFGKTIMKRGSHSEQLFLFIEELKQEHEFAIPELDAILVSEGPGSYTGLRISASAVKGLLFQTEVPLIAVNTLASFVMQAMDEHPGADTVHAIIDARRVHVYHQKFRNHSGELLSEDEPEVIPIEDFESTVREGDTIIGTGLDRIEGEIMDKTNSFGPDTITAKSLIRLYQSGFEEFFNQIEPASFDPKYYTSNQVK